MHETHIKHPVGFIQHEYFDLLNGNFIAEVEFHESARCCNQKINTVLKGFYLLLRADAAIQCGNPQICKFCQLLCMFTNLNYEFFCGC